MSRRRERSGRSLTDEDAELWRRVTRDAVPLPRTLARPARSAPESAAPPPPEPPAKPPRPAPPPRPAAKPEPAAPDLALGAAAGLDHRTAERLRRGLLPIEARIDLHGMVQIEAHGALVEFLQGAAAAGRRCVLVITGRGARSAGGMGVLRAAVPEWLNRAPCRGHVLAIAQARPQHGGDGALYVLLRRKRGKKSL